MDGGYTFHALREHHAAAATLVDTHPTEAVFKRARQYPQLRVIAGNFGDAAIAREVGTVDALFLFDVLLHQVAPDWDRILQMYAEQTRCWIIYNQQWIGSDRTLRLLELGEEEYFSNVPHDRTRKPYDTIFQRLDEIHPEHDKPWRDVHHIWQWGITDRDLRAQAESLGFRLQFRKNCGPFGDLRNFENHCFVYTRE